MATENDTVAEMIEKELRANPNAKTVELQERASKIDKSVAELNLRSFHSIHVGSIKRKISGKKGGRSKAARKMSGGRSRARASGGLSALAKASYDEKKAAVLSSMDGAFKKAVAADSLSGLEKLLAKMDKAGGMF